MSEFDARYSFEGDWSTDVIDQIASNRGFDSRSEYFRYLIREDIQEQIGETKLTVVPTND